MLVENLDRIGFKANLVYWTVVFYIYIFSISHG